MQLGRRTRGRHDVLLLWCAAVVGVVVDAVASVAVWQWSPLLATANLLVTATFAATAVLLVADRDQRGNAWLFVATSVLSAVGDIGAVNTGPLPLVSYVLGPAGFGCLAAVLLRYPGACISRASERRFVVAVLMLVVLRLVAALLSTPAPHGYSGTAWWITAADEPDLARWAGVAYIVAGCALAVVFIALAVARFLRTTGIDRRLLLPVVISAAACAVIIGCQASTELLPSATALTVPVLSIEAAALLTIPAAFLVSAVRRRLAHVAVADLVLQLTRPHPPDEVRAALRASVSDPTLDVAYWIEEFGQYRDAAGAAVDPTAGGRLTKLVRASDGGLLACITMDLSLIRYSTLVDAAAAAASMALENARLHAAVRAQLDEVRRSRARIVEAGDTERQRLERNLHDGAQQQLVALRHRLVAARATAQSGSERAVIDDALVALRHALDDVRDLAHGLHPAVLTQVGLRAALSAAARRQAVPVLVDVPDSRWDPTIEVALYYVACEAMANAAKHSSATTVAVTLAETDAELELAVTDDGDGGAELKPGGGLLGLRDRVEAADGTFVLSSPPGDGTRVVARFPRHTHGRDRCP